MYNRFLSVSEQCVKIIFWVSEGQCQYQDTVRKNCISSTTCLALQLVRQGTPQPIKPYDHSGVMLTTMPSVTLKLCLNRNLQGSVLIQLQVSHLQTQDDWVFDSPGSDASQHWILQHAIMATTSSKYLNVVITSSEKGCSLWTSPQGGDVLCASELVLAWCSLDQHTCDRDPDWLHLEWTLQHRDTMICQMHVIPCSKLASLMYEQPDAW